MFLDFFGIQGSRHNQLHGPLEIWEFTNPDLAPLPVSVHSDFHGKQPAMIILDFVCALLVFLWTSTAPFIMRCPLIPPEIDGLIKIDYGVA